jgi:hypothetical protein
MPKNETEKKSLTAEDVTKLRIRLQDATKRLQEAEAIKKRDATVHRENIGAIKGEITEIMAQLEG